MKKVFLISAMIVTLSAVILSSAVGNNKENLDTSQIASTESREILYVMKIHNNTVGVFKPDNEEPLYTLENVHVKSLPQYDQKLLNSGIKIYSEKQLKSLIEDYDS